ncbi:hypothetical protein TI03_03270 [Achromatium sp. WMS1]|nr:hypothetical protein TI03_03270 [Achromatium sp. WMS1]
MNFPKDNNFDLLRLFFAFQVIFIHIDLHYFYIFGIFCIVFTLLDGPGLQSSGNNQGFLYFIAYAGFIVWLAFGIKRFPIKFDFSYGIYIWHMPVINLLIILHYESALLAVILTIACSICSWFIVEQPALRLKHVTLRK